MIVRDLMTADPKTVAPEVSLAELADLLDDHAIRHAPVVDTAGDVIGVVSHRDLVQGSLRSRLVTTGEQRAALKPLVVADVMTYAPQTVAPDDAVADAAELMLENKLGCLLVLDNGELVGIITESDFVRHVAEAERERESATRRRARH
jgi:acetoin utilization protein AcuB